VDWTIIGADGHTINGSYAFTVNAAVQEETATPEAAPSSEPSAESSTEPSVAPEGASTDGASTDGGEGGVGNAASPSDNNVEKAATPEKSSTGSIIAFVIIGIAVCAAVVLLLRKRKS
jgi:cobalamin biosynthesis Mg chelatase CobN